MVEINADKIYSALRAVPEFDGNPNVLTRFIKLCDQLVLTFVSSDPGQELNNLILLNGILNKITGSAARTINSNGIPDNWNGIRNSLINNFSDQRDETALYNDLACQSQGSSTPTEFYDRCQSLFSTLMTYVSLHETLSTTVEAKRLLYRNLTLKAFVRGLNEPFGSRIRCMRPDTIEKALEFVQEELNIEYMQHRNSQNLPKFQQNVKVAPSFSDFRHSPVFHLPNSVPNWQRPTSAAPPQIRYQQPLGLPRFRMPGRTQQMFREPPPGFNPQSEIFKLPIRHAPPRPMSGVRTYAPKILPPSGHDWTRHGNPPPSNYFKTRELNLNATTDYDYAYFYPNYTNEPYYNFDHDCNTNYFPEYSTPQNNIQAYEEYGLCETNNFGTHDNEDSSNKNFNNENFHEGPPQKKLG